MTGGGQELRSGGGGSGSGSGGSRFVSKFLELTITLLACHVTVNVARTCVHAQFPPHGLGDRIIDNIQP